MKVCLCLFQLCECVRESNFVYVNKLTNRFYLIKRISKSRCTQVAQNLMAPSIRPSSNLFTPVANHHLFHKIKQENTLALQSHHRTTIQSQKKWLCIVSKSF